MICVVWSAVGMLGGLALGFLVALAFVLWEERRYRKKYGR